MRIVLLHGYDSSPDAMGTLAAELSSSGEAIDVICPAGSIVVGDDTYRWWTVDDESFDVTNALAELTDRVSLDDAIVIGFSQGGALATAAAMASGSPVRGIVCAAGFLAPGVEVRSDSAPMLLLHGDDDNVVDVFYAETLARSAVRAGIDVVLETYPGGHAWPIDAAARIGAWIARALQ